VYSYKNRSSYDFLNFIFSASSFNDALSRVEYLKSYRAYREERAGNIRNTQQLLQSKIDGLKVTRAEKEDVIKKQSKETQMLEEEKKEKDVVVQKLQSQEKELRREMATKQKQDQKLEGAIAAAVRRAIREASRKNAEASKAAAATDKPVAKGSQPVEAETPAAPATLNTIKSSAKTVFTSEEDLHLSGDFEKFKGQMPWPVSGTVSMSFGRHEYIKNIWHDNPGVTVDAQPGVAVKTVFEGVVSNIFNIGDVSAVMIRHGKYFTTYSNLSTVSVTQGEKLRTGQIIGRLAEIGQLEFVLSDEKGRNYDPERWLKR
jgi:septal ring factor EnvC (AmiA/AmiB activator)